MTTAPVADQQRLLEVQALDTRLAQLAHQRTHHPLHAQATELQARLDDVENAHVTSRTALGDLKRELAKAEQDVEQVRTRATRDRTRMESGSASVKDVQALSSELENLARRQEALEEVELEVMERLEAHETALAELTRARDELAAQRDRLAADLERELAAIDAQARAVQEERAQRADGIDAALVTLYDRLRGQLGGLAVALLRGRTCEGCRLELNPSDVARITAAPADQVVRCEECGRILVRKADADR
ncbi:zinc ribbon domain-containing protein [Actinotalea sp. Marseille-Q4924]|uniref:zinc ribbon domain-containing protein n=1 Tax=Actinotalea sp. Marseille-Q4924 TaxID=2866571 RepID=UPI001CE3B5CA|nr:C4-type zinc ribbon domain-containing protein [Actinotalea sp. Marseille-Q4924]